MIYITGDTHANIDIARNNYLDKHLKDTDILIVLGDFGYTWTSKTLKLWDKPFITLCVDGNHDNFDYLSSCPKTELFGSEVQVVKKNTYRLITGNMYTINNKRFFVFGGALSIDKASRIPHVSWWSEEIPTMNDYNKAIETLKANNYRFDYFLAHTCSEENCEHLFKYHYKIIDPTEKMLSKLEFEINFYNPNADYKYFFGHHHAFRTEGSYICLYDQIAKLGINSIEYLQTKKE